MISSRAALHARGHAGVAVEIQRPGHGIELQRPAVVGQIVGRRAFPNLTPQVRRRVVVVPDIDGAEVAGRDAAPLPLP